MLFDQTFSFVSHIKVVTRVAFFHLRNISKITVDQSCNLLMQSSLLMRLCGLLKKSFWGLQVAQNAVALLLTGVSKYEHIVRFKYRFGLQSRSQTTG